MGPLLSLKYNSLKSLHCEFIGTYLVVRHALGNQVLEGLWSRLSNERGRQRAVTVSWKEKRNRARICVIMDAHMTLSQTS